MNSGTGDAARAVPHLVRDGLIFLALMSASDATRAYAGLYERLASGVMSLWVFVIAWRLRTGGKGLR